MKEVSITYLGVPPESLRKNKGRMSHWRYRQRDTKTMRENAYMLILEAIGRARPHYDQFTVDITQAWCGKPLDAEALASGTGAMLDAFQDANIIDDDSPNGYLADYRLHWQRVPKMTDRRVTMTVRGVSLLGASTRRE
jgi:hypothetical protein